jgi:hypothetical protein
MLLLTQRRPLKATHGILIIPFELALEFKECEKECAHGRKMGKT